MYLPGSRFALLDLRRILVETAQPAAEYHSIIFTFGIKSGRNKFERHPCPQCLPRSSSPCSLHKNMRLTRPPVFVIKASTREASLALQKKPIYFVSDGDIFRERCYHAHAAHSSAPQRRWRSSAQSHLLPKRKSTPPLVIPHMSRKNLLCKQLHHRASE